jgi:thiamine phosphate synthase YjbQ (UPF0047 family)
MPRRSTATVRRQPVEQATTATGSIAIYSETLTIESRERVEVVDLTDLVMASVHRFPVRDHEWLHNDPDHSDCDRSNADAHLRALLLGHSLTLPLGGGEVVLGQWQRVLMGELDGPRTRSVRLQVMGVTGGAA